MADLIKIKTTRDTVVKVRGVVPAGQVLTVGAEISAKDARYLLRLGKAVPVALAAESLSTKNPKQDRDPEA